MLHHFGIPRIPEGLFGTTAGPWDGATTGGVQQLLHVCTQKHTHRTNAHYPRILSHTHAARVHVYVKYACTHGVHAYII